MLAISSRKAILQMTRPCTNHSAQHRIINCC